MPSNWDFGQTVESNVELKASLSPGEINSLTSQFVEDKTRIEARTWPRAHSW